MNAANKLVIWVVKFSKLGYKLSRSELEKRFTLILVQFLEIFFEIFEEEVSDY